MHKLKKFKQMCCFQWGALNLTQGVFDFNNESEVIHINIKDKFIETFGLEINEDNIATLLKVPIKKGKGVFTDLHNWKRYQDSPNSLLEDKALTLIFLKQYNYFKY